MFAAILLAGLVLGVSCDEDSVTQPKKYYASSPFSFGFAVKSRSTFTLESVNGTVTITGDPDAKSIVVSGTRMVGSSSMQDAEAHLDDLTVVPDSSETEARVRTEQPTASGGRDYVVDYSITLPDTFVVAAGGANGELNLQSLKRGVTVGYANVSITGTSIEGDTRMAIANGEIEAALTLLPGGQVALSAANAQIRLGVPVDTSARVQATNANGSIAVENLTFTDEVRTDTSLTGTLGAGNGSINISIANGSILLEGLLTSDQ
jgi:hypothetical protein